VIGVQAPLGQQLLHITIGKREAQVPADRKQDNLRFKLARHLKRPETEGARSIGPAYRVTPPNLQHFRVKRVSLLQLGVDSVMSLHQTRAVDFQRGKRLGKDDFLLQWKKTRHRTAVLSQEEFDALPESHQLRHIRLAVSVKGSA
jgi:hypothetical protein